MGRLRGLIGRRKNPVLEINLPHMGAEARLGGGGKGSRGLGRHGRLAWPSGSGKRLW